MSSLASELNRHRESPQALIDLIRGLNRRIDGTSDPADREAMLALLDIPRPAVREAVVRAFADGDNQLANKAADLWSRSPEPTSDLLEFCASCITSPSQLTCSTVDFLVTHLVSLEPASDRYLDRVLLSGFLLSRVLRSSRWPETQRAVDTYHLAAILLWRTYFREDANHPPSNWTPERSAQLEAWLAGHLLSMKQPVVMADLSEGIVSLAKYGDLASIADTSTLELISDQINHPDRTVRREVVFALTLFRVPVEQILERAAFAWMRDISEASYFSKVMDDALARGPVTHQALAYLVAPLFETPEPTHDDYEIGESAFEYRESCLECHRLLAHINRAGADSSNIWVLATRLMWILRASTS